ncbi:MAG: hypothetical protein ABFR65_04645 [Pseudomonadota bacterium]
MLIFIRLLPESVSQSNLREFVDQALSPPWWRLFSLQSSIHSTEIRKLTNGETYSIEYHGIVGIEPAMGAATAVRRLHRTLLKGKRVEVRKYYQRSPLRDRRVGRRRVSLLDECRKQDRRRKVMLTEWVSISGPFRAGHPRTAKVAAY